MMDIDQLKLILETLQMAGQGTSTLVLVDDLKEKIAAFRKLEEGE